MIGGLAGAGAFILIGTIVALVWYLVSRDSRTDTRRDPIAVVAAPQAPQAVENLPPVKPPVVAPAAAAEKPPPARPKAPANLDDWQQDLEAAKQQAAEQNKDILIYFDASDWCPYCIRLTQRVLLAPTFQERARQQFVFVRLDFPRGPVAKAKVQDPARNERLQKLFEVEGFPSLILTDEKGLPYAITGYQEGDADRYLAHLEELRQLRAQRDKLLEAVASARGATRLEAAKAALSFLDECNVIGHYGHLLSQWAELARAEDPTNEQGIAETLLLAAWSQRLQRAARDNNVQELAAVVDEVDNWRNATRIKQPDRLAQLYLKAGVRLSLANNADRARQCFQAGLVCKPADPELRQVLQKAVAGRFSLSSGTGFLVTADGYLLTNHHVVEGPGRLVVEVRRGMEPVAAEIVAKDEERDIALLRVQLPAGVKLLPLGIAGQKQLQGGESVVALGYPLGDTLGTGIKQTYGKVSGPAGPDNNQMILLDVRINPGNSGGPLLDGTGSVVGMVTAKTATGRAIDSYGLAVPSPELDAFLRKHLPNYRPAVPRAVPISAAEMNLRIAPSVLMVLKVL
ncbi:MAG TPA: trypsin-like peptidase domain-containing protein [Gemmataceae bacterium]|nr:trypsin-like peptidase domain-containing protein [Gemmataceae bacterium]